MTETEFVSASDALMQAVDDVVSDADIDVEAERSGNVLTLEADDGSQVVINCHIPTQQMWLASLKGGLHFEMTDGLWISTRDKKEFWECLSEALSFITKRSVKVTAP